MVQRPELPLRDARPVLRRQPVGGPAHSPGAVPVGVRGGGVAGVGRVPLDAGQVAEDQAGLGGSHPAREPGRVVLDQAGQRVELGAEPGQPLARGREQQRAGVRRLVAAEQLRPRQREIQPALGQAGGRPDAHRGLVHREQHAAGGLVGEAGALRLDPLDDQLDRARLALADLADDLVREPPVAGVLGPAGIEERVAPQLLQALGQGPDVEVGEQRRRRLPALAAERVPAAQDDQLRQRLVQPVLVHARAEQRPGAVGGRPVVQPGRRRLGLAGEQPALGDPDGELPRDPGRARMGVDQQAGGLVVAAALDGDGRVLERRRHVGPRRVEEAGQVGRRRRARGRAQGAVADGIDQPGRQGPAEHPEQGPGGAAPAPEQRDALTGPHDLVGGVHQAAQADQGARPEPRGRGGARGRPQHQVGALRVTGAHEADGLGPGGPLPVHAGPGAEAGDGGRRLGVVPPRHQLLDLPVVAGQLDRRREIEQPVDRQDAPPVRAVLPAAGRTAVAVVGAHRPPRPTACRNDWYRRTTDAWGPPGRTAAHGWTLAPAGCSRLSARARPAGGLRRLATGPSAATSPATGG